MRDRPLKEEDYLEQKKTELANWDYQENIELWSAHDPRCGAEIVMPLCTPTVFMDVLRQADADHQTSHFHKEGRACKGQVAFMLSDERPNPPVTPIIAHCLKCSFQTMIPSFSP
ncbi:hypothetical protein BLNAU_12270 [Blattamonas nauphoetae]|uniref:Uncharacterized protein n=1 Tax=Blattamonas nauphoetae TaxID=2049346 RepID=A0ABQ9XN30_9EUKA|nr:hypothetical protein BLNAU_12270 [Blattamonas nauphoetae]